MAAAAVCAGALAACPAFGQDRVSAAEVRQERGLTLRLGGRLEWDSNVYRVSDSAPDPGLAEGKTGRSDVVNTSFVGLRLEEEYSQQKGRLEIVETATRFSKFSGLDNNSLAYSGEGQWHLTPRVSGTLGATRMQSLVGFGDVGRGTSRNVRLDVRRYFTVDGWLFGGWHLLAGMSQEGRRNDTPSSAQPNMIQRTAETGIRYVTGYAQDSITIVRRRRYSLLGYLGFDAANAVDFGYEVQEYEASAIWTLSAKSSLVGRLTKIEHRHQHLPRRDFGGNAADLGYIWTPTGKLRLNLAAQRGIQPWTPDMTASYRVTDTRSVEAISQVGEKTRVVLGAQQVAVEYLGALAGSAPAAQRVRRMSIAAEWLPSRNVNLGMNFRRERRDSSSSLYTYKDMVAGVNGTLIF